MPRPVQPLGTFGTINVKRQPAGVYLAVTRYRDFDGSYRRVKKSGATARQAENALKQSITELGERERAGDLTRRSSVRDAAELWRVEERAAGRIAPQSMDRYEADLDGVVLPALGSLRLGEVTVGTVDRFLKSVAATRPGRAKTVKVALSHVLGLATRHDAIRSNPVAQVGRLPKAGKKEIRVAAVDELAVIRAAITAWQLGGKKHGPKPDGQLGKIFELMLGTASRIGEALAVRVCDIRIQHDPDNIGAVRVLVTISGTIVYVRGQGYIRQEHPKHSKDWRVVTLPDFAADVVLERLAELGDVPGERTLFCSRNATPLSPANVRRQWREAREAFTGQADGGDLASITPHVFRKTGATTVAGQSTIELAAQLLGHSSTAITREFYVKETKQINAATALILEQLGPHRGGSGNRLTH